VLLSAYRLSFQHTTLAFHGAPSHAADGLSLRWCEAEQDHPIVSGAWTCMLQWSQLLGRTAEPGRSVGRVLLLAGRLAPGLMKVGSGSNQLIDVVCLSFALHPRPHVVRTLLGM
jgi:hypothetical protein